MMCYVHVLNQERYFMNLLTKTILMSSLFALSACSVSTGCDDYHAYRYTNANVPVQVPADLQQPLNESTAPKTEATDPKTVDRNAAGECLEKPPKL